MSVLVVEDDRSIRETLCELIDEEGYVSMSAENGREALDLLEDPETKLPSLILLDMMMPVMDGWAFRAELEKNSRLSKIPVFLLSAHANLQAIASTINVAGFLKKPLDLNDLLAVLAKYNSKK